MGISFSANKRMAVIALIYCQAIYADNLPKPAEALLTAKVDAKTAYWKEKAELQLAYRQKIGKLISGCDKMEVFLLDFSMEDVEVGVESFPISPFDSETKVIKKVEVNKSDSETFRDMVSTMLSSREPEEAGSFCHYPIHGIRLYQSGVLVFQTSFCWSCDNYYFEFPDGAGWCQLGYSRAGLKNLFERILPIPSGELKRFEKALEKQNNQKK